MQSVQKTFQSSTLGGLWHISQNIQVAKSGMIFWFASDPLLGPQLPVLPEPVALTDPCLSSCHSMLH